MAIAQMHDELPRQGMQQTQNVSILSFSDTQVIDTAHSLGVSLGNSQAEHLISAKMIKDNELSRTLTMLRKCEDSSNNAVENVSQCLVVSRASNLSEDLEDEENLENDAGFDMPPIVAKERKTRKKKSYDKNNVRRSNRIRIKKSKS